MEWVFLIVLVGALTYVGVEAMKHFMPSWYDKQQGDSRHYLHERMDVLLNEVKKLTGGK